jgi:deazaflavin-dependent oxidoreductase (nitroreductase family)
MTDATNIDATQLHGPEHVRVYEETDGEAGHDWKNGTSVLILTTTGRKSGEERKNALIYGMAGDHPMVVASKGGYPQHPGWYVNLRDNPEVRVQIKGDTFTAHARDATPEERPELWKQMTEHWPDYDNYQQKTDREIPIVVLERTGGNLDSKFVR